MKNILLYILIAVFSCACNTIKDPGYYDPEYAVFIGANNAPKFYKQNGFLPTSYFSVDVPFKRLQFVAPHTIEYYCNQERDTLLVSLLADDPLPKFIIEKNISKSKNTLFFSEGDTIYASKQMTVLWVNNVFFHDVEQLCWLAENKKEWVDAFQKVYGEKFVKYVNKKGMNRSDY